MTVAMTDERTAAAALAEAWPMYMAAPAIDSGLSYTDKDSTGTVVTRYTSAPPTVPALPFLTIGPQCYTNSSYDAFNPTTTGEYDAYGFRGGAWQVLAGQWYIETATQDASGAQLAIFYTYQFPLIQPVGDEPSPPPYPYFFMEPDGTLNGAQPALGTHP